MSKITTIGPVQRPPQGKTSKPLTKDPTMSSIGKIKNIIDNNGVIDLQSENLTYHQAKAIRSQVQKDVELLRNRVRMLK